MVTRKKAFVALLSMTLLTSEEMESFSKQSTAIGQASKEEGEVMEVNS